ncbi:excisionase family DNA binding protein [Kaistia hirudinis]|uniref:Excisionase family DNA binding protein n=1 Tax=Kaistia hirudinis TaxID=1293440 RepID=A0A840ARV2_9HYPH|nr:helix-turn-helix domain-containing protein [Kaistia hirudinis]MBB3931205.1 excisionase family DNA binding protein [Kaistia hirudinis]
METMNSSLRTESSLFNTREAADYLNLSKSTLDMKRLKGGGPVFCALGRRVVYKRSDLDAWVDANRRRSTSEVA